MKALLLAAGLVLITGTAARADVVTQVAWDRTGAEALPCEGSVQWTLAPGHGITAATVGINDDDGINDGHAWTMQQAADESWHITSTEPVGVTDVVLVAYLGNATAPPVLSLVDCTPVVVVPPPVDPPPVDPPPVDPPPSGGTTPPTQTPPTQTPPPVTTTWDIGFRVTTISRTNVLAKWRLVCSSGGIAVPATGRVRARTPLVRHLAPTIDGATSCHLRVRAYDIPPHVRPHNWPAPVVRTWVTAS